MLEVEKMEIKKLKTFQKLLDPSGLAQVQFSVQLEQAEPEQKKRCLRGN